MDSFDKYLKENNINLTKQQKAVADNFLASKENVKFISSGLGSGKTFLFRALEAFGKVNIQNG